ncbi:MAG: FAD-dependent oxidoreductase [bacterium]|nr:FAD-dependent oxidoreductase [bacterium]
MARNIHFGERISSTAASYDVIIIGGGVTGTSLLYMLGNYTNVNRIALVEKYESVAMVNSNPRNNSQTLHFGDIETNITLQKARRLKEAGELIKRYMERISAEGNLYRKSHKMVLAVGPEECYKLDTRYVEFVNLFPGLIRLPSEKIAELEPRVMEGRHPGDFVLALMSKDGYAVNYQRLSFSFLMDAYGTGKDINSFFNTEVADIRKASQGYEVETSQGIITAPVVIVASGPYSLNFAQTLGYGQNLGILPVAGSFYFSHKVLNGKVYTMQNDRVPFAAPHGDPDVVNPAETRFGPTAKPLPLLERHHYHSMIDFSHSPMATLRGLWSFWKITNDPVIRAFMLRNAVYEVPIVGKRVFLQSVRKIIPTMEASELTFGKGLGGIRPQVVNLETGELQHGEATIEGDNIIFITTPSPGASVCLKNAVDYAHKVVGYLGKEYSFDERKFVRDFKD